MIYYIADMHFGHKNVLRFDNRPFPDTENMDEYMIQSWNGRITEDDTVYVLGDAFWKNEEGSVNIMHRLNGHKHLIKGNPFQEQSSPTLFFLLFQLTFLRS